MLLTLSDFIINHFSLYLILSNL